MSKDDSVRGGGAPLGRDSLEAPDGLEKMYVLKVAAEMIPMPSVQALYSFLTKHKEEFPRRYRRTGWYEVRLLTESEILRIREITIHGLSRSRYLGNTSEGRTRTAIGAVMRRAMED